MTPHSLADRVATARRLIEECTRDAGNVSPGVEADLWEALEFLNRLDEALEEDCTVVTPRRDGDESPSSDDSALPGDEPALPGDEPALPGDEPALPGDEPALPGDEPAPSGDEPAPSGEDAPLPADEQIRSGEDVSPDGDGQTLPRVHSYSDIVVFRPVEGDASQYIVATPGTVLALEEWR